MEVSEILARLSELPPEQRALVERTLAGRTLREPDGGPRTCETSVTQQGLWLIDRISPGDRLYTIGWRLRLTGRLDTGALATAVDTLVARHAALRTTFTDEDGRPLQVVQPRSGVPVPVPVDDLRALEDGERERRTDAICAAEVAPFDLRKGPLARFRLIRLADEEHLLTMVVHHIVFDAVSVDVALRDLSGVYNALVAGGTPPRTPPPPQYPDFARWQRRHLTGDRLDRLIGHWRGELEGAPGLLALPALRPRPAEQSHAGAEYTAVLPARLAEGLRALARGERCTLYTVLLAAFQVVLSRYSGQRDLSVGTVVHGRVRGEFEQMVGYFVNTLVLRADLSGDPGFREHLRRTRSTFLSAYDHQALPFDRLVEELAPHRGLSHNPLVQVVFESHDEDEWQRRTQFTGLTTGQLLPIELGRSKFDLNVSAVERDGTIDVTVEYATDLFDAAGVARLVAHYRRLLESVVARPDAPVGELDMLLPHEHALFAARPAQPPAPACPHDLVHRQAAATPLAPAVSDGGREVSYRDLDTGAERLARRLAAHGVAPETVVAVALPASPDQVRAVLAVLRAGGVCLPLDPGASPDSLAAVLADARPALVITGRTAPRALRDGAAVLALDDLDALGVDEDLVGAALPGRVPVGGAAFLLYTGSDDGPPRGVLLTHAGLANAFRHAAAALSVTRDDTVAGHGAPGTALALFETFTALTAGARLVPRPGDTPGGGLLTATGPKTGERALALREDALFGGDDGRPVTAGYGPTETSVLSLVAAGRADPAGRLPGGAVPGVHARVLDADLRRLPPGAHGELYIGGAGLARGYHHGPARTAARFLPDPYGPPGARMFRTGDLARLDDEGRVVVLGRAGHRVPVRGLPLEPGAVEAVLSAHPDVARVAVSVPGTADGPRPVAHVVAAWGVVPDPQRLRRYVADRLAAHMVPAAVLVTDRLPTAPDGRLHRAALPVPGPAGGAGREPGTAREAVLRELFADVLGVPSVALDDDFFDIGGHSMLAARLIARVSDALGVEMGLRTLFEAPTVAELARALGHTDERSGGDDLDVVLPLRPTGDGTPVFCVHPGMGLGWSFAGLVRHLHPRHPVYALQSPGLAEGAAAVPETVEETADIYLRHIRKVAPHGPYHLVGWSSGGLIAHAAAVRLREQGEPVGVVAVLDGYPLAGRAAALPGREEELADLRLETAGLEVGEELRSRLTDVYTAVARGARRHVPRRYDGDLVHVAAADRRDGGAFVPDLWLPYVGGTLVRHVADCTHEEMTRPEILAHIGPRLAEHLDRADRFDGATR
ncbi:condensation domain-containing protein [Streptomyces sp. NPDC047000]|uniref:condensation domain-containing protein n=1 Tax=Streptomyces sp. NPDC047000 TaxID=3155474 RepID=UPI0033F492AC